jgi:hypothetical protein
MVSQYVHYGLLEKIFQYVSLFNKAFITKLAC